MTRVKLKHPFSQIFKKESPFQPVGRVTGKVTTTLTPEVLIFWSEAEDKGHHPS